MTFDLDRAWLRPWLHRAFLFTRGMTMGVRGIAIDGENRVCLVRHTYVAGWHLPGGGIERGETAADSMIREFREEAEIRVEAGTMRLHGLCLNRALRARDHVAVFVAPAWTFDRPKTGDREIAESRLFPLDALPPDITRGTAERLAEIREGRPAAAHW